MRLGAPLIEVEGGMAGTLEVFHSGAWGSVCSAMSHGDSFPRSSEVQIPCLQSFDSANHSQSAIPGWNQNKSIRLYIRSSGSQRLSICQVDVH